MPQAGSLEDRLRSVAQDAPAEEKPAPKPAIDREKTCPLLLRVFTCNGRHHPLSDYARGNVPNNELQIYTWMDATLKELTSLVKEVNPDARRKGTKFEFSTVYMERNGRHRYKDIGRTMAGLKGPDDNVTLQDQKFQIGDFMDIAISMPQMGRRDSWR
ncbi:histone deacetylase complex subunit SAP18-like [Styela clava]|uniref:histone deacetylase complex subunit SAP18-like n=1 Tax=Styela clava TaxID=7725 RepID=UPI00193A5531|nr:histone deacetylase complex subunit SAP18-like [Styela clava]XP_039261117.1 histone deacetylase complex subunit SAP18-like [Styela clava]